MEVQFLQLVEFYCFDQLDKLSPTDEIPAYTEAERELSVKLFAILASYLKARCLSLVKSMAKSKDGFKLWRALLQEYEPSSRQRSLALAQTLSNYPAFSGSKTIRLSSSRSFPMSSWFNNLRKHLHLHTLLS